MNSITNKVSFTISLSFEAHSIAQQCRQGISNPDKAKQVYLNTLAVYAVDNYLRCMGFQTDWDKSDSRNPLAIKLMDVADLEVKNIGKLECRPVLPEAQAFEVPLEVWEDRIGYVAVQLNSSVQSANILGFTHQAAVEVSLDRLQSLEDFLLYLTELEEANHQKEESLTIVKIGHWLEGVIDAGWQTIDELLKPQQLGLAFKNEVSMTRGQKIDLGMQLDKITLALVVKITSESETEVDILTQVHPFGEIALPEGVKLIISDESGATVLEAVSREEDNWIQQEFSAELGEKFRITVAFGESKVTKEFEV
ncbi:DUF1822 family protein [Iningainema tapete]|uniref:DUF1822 family protein n=1 Tax=Iningainema tapete BLCC-T55 TaxID=2748662 RepID=A0A8J6Y1D2_9CYAN|nr:DUF1822 family protein [Iningainema tapete]MBD2777463.1 DUF1822 family protein [Iningainema tapete BLCC-T55]